MFLSLVSGSSGNAALLKNADTTILIDCGLSGKKLMGMLDGIGISCNEIDAMLITHEHIDHTMGAGVISRRFDIPIYTTEKCFSDMNIGVIREKNMNIIFADSDFSIGSVDIHSFSISHDAANPVGFSLVSDNKKYSIATDTGVMTDNVFNAICGSDYVMLEANHDVEMLKCGEYPFSLKQRILGEKGHLSNDAAAEVAVRLLENNTKNIMLAHLSDKNNMPDIAYNTVCEKLKKCGAVVGEDINLKVARRYEVTSFI